MCSFKAVIYLTCLILLFLAGIVGYLIYVVKTFVDDTQEQIEQLTDVF